MSVPRVQRDESSVSVFVCVALRVQKNLYIVGCFFPLVHISSDPGARDQVAFCFVVLILAFGDVSSVAVTVSDPFSCGQGALWISLHFVIKIVAICRVSLVDSGCVHLSGGSLVNVLIVSSFDDGMRRSLIQNRTAIVIRQRDAASSSNMLCWSFCRQVRLQCGFGYADLLALVHFSLFTNSTRVK